VSIILIAIFAQSIFFLFPKFPKFFDIHNTGVIFYFFTGK